MLYHLSFNAREPERVAPALAEILDAKVLPAPGPPFNPGAIFVACADDRGTLIVLEPWGVTYVPGPGASLEMPHGDASPDHNGFHGLFESKVDVETIGKVAEREGWPWGIADYGAFKVVNVWVEGSQLLEFATPEMLPDYLALFGTGGLIANLPG